MRSMRRAIMVLAVLSLPLVAPRVTRADPPPTNEIAEVVSRVSPAVVRIITVRVEKPKDEAAGPKVAAALADETSTATGSGFIIDPRGYIATNKHVVDGAAALFVVTSDGVRHKASVVGMPGKADMALIRIYSNQTLPYVSLGDSDKARVGDTVIAIGSPFGFDNSVTAGIVSAVNRDIMESPFDDYLQTDAAINHGNSGGPLFNIAGEVIGMNSVIFAPGTGSVGVGFAIPSNDLAFVFGRLIKTGAIDAGMLPIATQQVSWMLKLAMDAPDLQGALVSSVHDDGELMLHGKILPGDIILSFNGQKVLDPRDLARKAARAPVGSDATLGIFSHGANKTINVKIQEWPPGPPVVLRDDDQRALGLDLVSADGDKGQHQVVVASVDPMGTAADSGIQKGDIIREIQQTVVTDPDQALRLFWVQSSQRHHFAAVLVERDKKLSWMPLAVPD